MPRICPALVFCLAATAAPPAPAVDQCARWEAQYDSVQQQLRRPHSAAEGNRLRARLRSLRERIAHDCR
jgi:hypothetical protein